MKRSEFSWYCLVPCNFPEGHWRLTQHTYTNGYPTSLDDNSDMTITSVAEGNKQSLINAVRNNGLDIFFPITKEEPIFYNH